MSAPAYLAQSTFALLRSATALQVAVIVASSGPVSWPRVQSTFRGPRLVSDRSIRHCLMRLYRLGLADRRPGHHGLLAYHALPALRRLLKAMNVSLSSFSSPRAPDPTPTDSHWSVDDPASLGL